MEGCSWGAFQELGENWEGLGFTSVGEFVDFMKMDCMVSQLFSLNQ